MSTARSNSMKVQKEGQTANIDKEKEILAKEIEKGILLGQIRADRIKTDREQQRGSSSARVEAAKVQKEIRAVDAAKERDVLEKEIEQGKVAALIRADRERNVKESLRAMHQARAQGAKLLKEKRETEAAEQLERLVSEIELGKIESEVRL